MATLVGKESNINDMLDHLVRLDYAAIEAYEAAVARLENPEYKAQLENFCEDHRRHTRNIGALLSARGEDAPNGPGPKAILTQGKVVMANLMGDTAILAAMLTNEKDTNTAYGRAVDHKECTPELRQVLEANLADERRHRAWLERVIAENARDKALAS